MPPPPLPWETLLLKTVERKMKLEKSTKQLESSPINMFTCEEDLLKAPSRLLYGFVKEFLYKRGIEILIPTSFATNLLLSFSYIWQKPKTRIKFSVNCWPGNKRYFVFLLIASHALLQKQAKLIRLTYYSFMFEPCETHCE